MKDAAAVAVELKGINPLAVEGNAFRFSGLGGRRQAQYNREPLSGGGALARPYRFNPAGHCRVLYLGDTPDTALLEIQAAAYAGADKVSVPVGPKAMWSVKYWLEAVLDLTRPDVRQRLGLTQQELTGHWWLDDPLDPPATQVLGRLAFDSGRFDAIRYRSARQGQAPGNAAVNLAVFPDRLAATGGRLEVYLPPGESTPPKVVYKLP